MNPSLRDNYLHFLEKYKVDYAGLLEEISDGPELFNLW